MKKLILLLALLASFPGASRAQTVLPIQVTEVALGTTEDAAELPYLILELPLIEIPKGMRLEECVVEFYLDASRAPGKELPGETVTIEVYPFSGSTSTRLDVASLGKSSMKRSVPIGSDRRVRFYVTEFAQYVIANPSANRRLIVGSIVGERSARFTAKSLPGTSGSKASLTAIFSPVEDTSSGQINSK